MKKRGFKKWVPDRGRCLVIVGVCGGGGGEVLLIGAHYDQTGEKQYTWQEFVIERRL